MPMRTKAPIIMMKTWTKSVQITALSPPKKYRYHNLGRALKYKLSTSANRLQKQRDKWLLSSNAGRFTHVVFIGEDSYY